MQLAYKIGKTMKKPIYSYFAQRSGASLLAAGTVLAATLIMALIGEAILGQGVVALLYLAPIAWCTVRWGRLAGIERSPDGCPVFRFLLHSAPLHLCHRER